MHRVITSKQRKAREAFDMLSRASMIFCRPGELSAKIVHRLPDWAQSHLQHLTEQDLPINLTEQYYADNPPSKRST